MSQHERESLKKLHRFPTHPPTQHVQCPDKRRRVNTTHIEERPNEDAGGKPARHRESPRRHQSSQQHLGHALLWPRFVRNYPAIVSTLQLRYYVGSWSKVKQKLSPYPVKSSFTGVLLQAAEDIQSSPIHRCHPES